MFRKIIIPVLLLSLGFLVLTASASDGNDKVKAIVLFKDKPAPDDLVYLERQGGAVKYNYNIINAVALEIPEKAYNKINETCQNGKGRQPAICEKISNIELDQQVHLIGKPDNKESGKPAPSQPEQVMPWGIKRIDAEPSWGKSTGNGTKVAVVDTGIDFQHPDLAGNVKGGVSFVKRSKGYRDDNGHGTHVAGTIAALNNEIGVVGVAPDAWLYGVKVLDRKGSGWLSDVIAGIDWSTANGMQVITMSLGSSGSSNSLEMAVDNAYNQGIVIVAAAGNDYGGTVSYPARYDSVIAVTATDSGDNIASFSNTGQEAELAAPGVGIYSTYKGGSYATLSGTSMATPHVTGTVALLLASNESLEPPEVRKRLGDTATDLGDSGRDIYYGFGLVNASAALS
ncbi:MAG: S8 family peptidase [Candidatus Methanoperedens sp.]